MRRLCLIIAIICAGFLCACSQTEENAVVNSWDYSVTCAEKSEDNIYVSAYIDEAIVSTTGCLSFENKNDFQVIMRFYIDGTNKITKWIEANSKIVLYGMEKAAEYTIELEAEVEEGTEIKLSVHDGVLNLVESESGKAVSVEKAIKVAQKYIDKWDRELVTNYDNPTVEGIVGDGNKSMLDLEQIPKNYEWVDPDKYEGRELYRISFSTGDANSGPITLYVDKYKGVLLGGDIIM